ncbi:MAG TPA: HEAT repeat domain-containing protein, partial [Brevundimonas sp.]
NSGDAALIASVEALLDDPAPVVRGASAWALAQLAPERFEAARAARLGQETDEEVRQEWSFSPCGRRWQAQPDG